MHSVLQRSNAILAYALSVLACLTFVCFASTVFLDYPTNVTVQPVNVVVSSSRRSNSEYGVWKDRNDLGSFQFNLEANLSHLFNWNVKQLFLYLTAEYETPNNQLNQVVLWDKIVLRGENAVFNLQNMNTKYYFWDDGTGLKGNKNVTLTLSWNIIPNAGLLPNIFAHGSHSFAFPSEYLSSRV